MGRKAILGGAVTSDGGRRLRCPRRPSPGRFALAWQPRGERLARAHVCRRPTTLSISLLGPMRIDGTSQPSKRIPTRELIAYLTLHPHGASRDELIEALWPAQDLKKTRRRL